ncbi:MAG: cytochrome c [Saccharospirillum sp.]|nr:cytochrome c [Saccharospirillum sp.]
MSSIRSMTPIFRTLAAVCLTWGLNASLAHAEGDAARGEARAASCAACHGPGGRSLNPSVFPAIAGMEPEQMVTLLKAYRDGDKVNPIMSPQAQGLSDQDILDLAAYFSNQ